MRFIKLVETQELIPPGQDIPADDLESESDKRWSAINDVEKQVAQHYFRVYQKAGIELFDDDGIPVSVSFYEKDQTVEVQVTTDDSFKVDALIKLSEAGAIGPTTEIAAYSRRGHTVSVLTTMFPARDTPFSQFLDGSGSVGTASSSGSV